LNSFQTDTTSLSGPASASSQTVQQRLLQPITGVAGTIAFNSSGRIVTIRVTAGTGGEEAQTLLLLDPATLQALPQADLPPRPRPPGSVRVAGGGYLYLDNLDRAVCVTATQQIRIYGVEGGQFVLQQACGLSASINASNDILNSVLPDSFGNLWFITKHADV